GAAKGLQGLHHQRRQHPGPIWSYHWPADLGPAGRGRALDEELRKNMRTKHIITFAVLVGGSFAASAALAWDQDPFVMYFQRSDKIPLGAGDAKAVNAPTHVTAPWPRCVGNRRIPGNGDRLSRAVERSRLGSYRQPAPPISPYPAGGYAVSGGAGGGGFGGGGLGGGRAGGGLGGGGAASGGRGGR